MHTLLHVHTWAVENGLPVGLAILCQAWAEAVESAAALCWVWGILSGHTCNSRR